CSLLAGYPAAALAAFTTTAVLGLIPALPYGPGIYVQWLATVNAYAGVDMPGNGSLLALTSRLGLSQLGTMASATLAGLLITWSWLRRLRPLHASSLALAGALVVAPISWPGYRMFLVPI